MLLKLLLLVTSTLAEREHKVHNIILYPEKYSWCQTTPIQQVVAKPGYEPVTIDNNVCVGACYSYSIPSTQPAEPGELLRPYCDSCQPIKTECYHVTLHADARNRDDPRTFQKGVQIIQKCSCMSCENLNRGECEVSDKNTLELPHDLFSNHTEEIQTEEVPELLQFASRPPPGNISILFANMISNEWYKLKADTVDLLKKIQSGDNRLEKKQLEELAGVIKGQESELREIKLVNFVNFFNIHYASDLDEELEVERLKDVLNEVKTQKNNVKKYNLLDDFGVEGKPHRHHLGDEVHAGADLGHLVQGPHGSMVLSPNIKVEEKLNIDSDVLKPNHDGVVIAYEDHANRKPNHILTN